MNANYFIQKQDRINSAIEKVQDKLKWFSTEAAKIVGNWTAENHEQFKDWNNYHDLKDRLEMRRTANYCDYQSWHFNTKGWAAYL
jgi:predicted nuclease with TOPRIM domain